MNILSVISSTKLKEINIKGFNGFFTLNNLYYSTNLTHSLLMQGIGRNFDFIFTNLALVEKKI